MILAFTGTRKGMTAAQRAALPSVLAALPERVLHGGAEGADEEFDTWLVERGMSTLSIEIWPCNWDRDDFWRRSGKYHGASRPGVNPIIPDPLLRNRVIAERCDALLACPAETTEQLRSGTWSTVRYARKAGKLITIIAPDGTVREER
jgi:hypothetical protein